MDERKEMWCDKCGKKKYDNGVVDASYRDDGYGTARGHYSSWSLVCPKCGNTELEKVEYSKLDIDWSVDEITGSIDAYDKEVIVTGYDDNGNEYRAYAVESCGEIVNVEEIEKI